MSYKIYNIGLFNFKTGEVDSVKSDLSDLTDETAKLYISQQSAAQRLFEVRRKLRDSISEAMATVLRIQAGETTEERTE